MRRNVLPSLPEDTPTTKLYLQRITGLVVCEKHGADYGKPCFVVPSLLKDGVWNFGICNTRARRAGFVGDISDMAMQRSRRRS